MLKVMLGPVCLTAALGRWVNRPQQQRKKRKTRKRETNRKKQHKNKEKEGEGGHRCDQDVTTPGLVSGAALAGAGDGEPQHSCCLPLLSQRVAAR